MVFACNDEFSSLLHTSYRNQTTPLQQVEYWKLIGLFVKIRSMHVGFSGLLKHDFYFMLLVL